MQNLTIFRWNQTSDLWSDGLYCVIKNKEQQGMSFSMVGNEWGIPSGSHDLVCGWIDTTGMSWAFHWITPPLPSPVAGGEGNTERQTWAV